MNKIPAKRFFEILCVENPVTLPEKIIIDRLNDIGAKIEEQRQLFFKLEERLYHDMISKRKVKTCPIHKLR